MTRLQPRAAHDLLADGIQALSNAAGNGVPYKFRRDSFGGDQDERGGHVFWGAITAQTTGAEENDHKGNDEKEPAAQEDFLVVL